MTDYQKVFWSKLFEKGESNLKDNFVYYGGREGNSYQYFKQCRNKGERKPCKTNECLCGHYIEKNMFIKSKTNDKLIVVGSCCYKKFIPYQNQGKQCNRCGTKHRNVKDNLCNECRQYKNCENCNEEFIGEYNNCDKCRKTCERCEIIYKKPLHNNICKNCRNTCRKCKVFKNFGVIDNLCNECRMDIKLISFGKFKNITYKEFLDFTLGKKSLQKKNESLSYIRWMKTLNEDKLDLMEELIRYVENN